MCMLHAFHIGIITALGKAIPLDEIYTNLRKEFLTNYKSYQSFSDDSVNVLVELEKFLSDPLEILQLSHFQLFSHCPWQSVRCQYCRLQIKL